MSIFREGFPNVAYFIPDKNNLTARIAFKCRIVSDAPQFFNQPIAGMVDVGTNMTIVTWKRLDYKVGAKVLFNDVLYSVQSITPFIPDPSRAGFTKQKLQAEYLIQLV